MPQVQVTFDAADDYERVMGQWSRLIGERFLDWLAPALHVYPKDGLFRVHAGPYASQTDARATAEKLSQALGIKAVVLTR